MFNSSYKNYFQALKIYNQALKINYQALKIYFQALIIILDAVIECFICRTTTFYPPALPPFIEGWYLGAHSQVGVNERPPEVTSEGNLL
jgi:hypothetical protein